MDYKPYTLEWSRKRYLSEAIQKYFDDGTSSKVIVGDIIDILYNSASYHRDRAEKIQTVIDLISSLEQ